MKKMLALLLGMLCFTAANAQTIDRAKLDEFLNRLAEKNKAMGNLLLTKDGKKIYANAIGYAAVDGPTKKLATQSTRYRIGSITKMFTATMIFQLVEEGRLKLSDKLDQFFPNVPDAHQITIDQILAHRSGIHEVSNDSNFRGLRTKLVSKQEIIDFIEKSKPDFRPGTGYAYSSAGYFLLGCIIEKLTGKSYQEALDERISGRIALKDTYAASGNIDEKKNEAFSYKYGRDWDLQQETHSSILFGAGSLISTSADLAKFIQALFEFKLVAKASLEKMMQQQQGMDVFTYNGKAAFGHTGGVDGFGAWLIYIPEEKLAVAYTSNGKVYPVADIIDGVLKIYWHQPFDIPTFNSITIGEETLQKYVGVYAIDGAPIKFTVSRNGSSLYLQASNKPTVIPLEPTGPDQFNVEGIGMEVEFNTTKNQLILKRNGGQRVFTKEK